MQWYQTLFSTTHASLKPLRWAPFKQHLKKDYSPDNMALSIVRQLFGSRPPFPGHQSLLDGKKRVGTLVLGQEEWNNLLG